MGLATSFNREHIRVGHWCLNIVPNLPIASLEKEGKMFLNPVLPEEAAQFLREVRIEQAIPA